MSKGTRKDLEQTIRYYDKLANDARMHGMREESKRLEQKSVKLRDELFEKKMGTVEGRLEIAGAYDRLADIAKEQRLYSKAKNYLLKGLELRSSVAKETKSAKDLHEVYASYGKLERLSDIQFDKNARSAHLQKMLEISSVLKRKRGSLQDLIDYQYCCYFFFFFYLQRAESREKGKKLLRIAAGMDKDQPHTQIKSLARRARQKLRNQYGRSPEDYRKQGENARAHGMLEEARYFYLKSLEKRLSIVEEKPSLREEAEIVRDCISVGDIDVKLGNTEEAEKLYRAGKKLTMEMMQDPRSNSALPNYAVACERLGDLARERWQYELAREWFEEELRVCEKLLRENNSSRNRRFVLFSYNRIADLLGLLDLTEEAEEWSGKEIELATALSEEEPSEETFGYLQSAYHTLGMMLFLTREQKNVDRAKELFRKIIEISEQHCEFPKLENLAEEVRVLL